MLILNFYKNRIIKYFKNKLTYEYLHVFGHYSIQTHTRNNKIYIYINNINQCILPCANHFIDVENCVQG